MPEIEIIHIPPLKPSERALVEMHSVLNFLNVLRMELALLGISLADDPDYLQESHALIDRLGSMIGRSARSPKFANSIDDQINTIRTEIEGKLTLHQDRRDDPEVRRSLLSLHSTFSALRAHAGSLIARAKNSDVWGEATPDELQRELREVLTAMQHSSHGRYGFVYDPARQRRTDYYVDFRFKADRGQNIYLPLVLKDVMRDLMANARKYTAPGGRITVLLEAERETLRLVVSDTGRGIPSEELAAVVSYGHRGSNVADVRTSAGGFGLTKAFLVTKQFGGRFWIASELGCGTTVRIEIPA